MAENNEFQNDGRYFPRWEVANKVTYRKEHGVSDHDCVSRDISNTGVCLRTYEKIIPNEKLSMTIQLDGGVSVQAQGRTVWEKDNGNDFLVGVRFEELSQKVQDMIFNFAFEGSPSRFQEKWFEGV
jgi:hypothetical protein